MSDTKNPNVRLLRKPNQSVERLISTFNKKFQKSRIGQKAQSKRYRQDNVNRNKRRIKAIKRDENRAKRAKMQFR